MVLGSKANNRRSHTLHRDFLIHIQEIKPWPPSQSLRTLRSILIQWEYGERYSGSTSTVVPLLGNGIGDGKIEFNESFRISVTLARDNATFQKSCLELNLYEPRRDKTVKGQLLGTATVDFAEYGIVKEAQSITIPINSKRIYNNTAKPLLYMKIQAIEKGRTSSSTRENLSKVLSMERNGGESVSALMNEEYAEEAEIASISDDDVSPLSSMTLSSSSAFETDGVSSHPSHEEMTDCPGQVDNKPDLAPIQQLFRFETKTHEEVHETELMKDENGSSCNSEMRSSSLYGSKDITQNGILTRKASIDLDLDEKLKLENSIDLQDNVKQVQSLFVEVPYVPSSVDILHEVPVNSIDVKEHRNEHVGEVRSKGEYARLDERLDEFSEDDSMEKLKDNSNRLDIIRSGHVKSVRSSLDSGGGNASVRSGKFGDAYYGSPDFTSNTRKETKVYTKKTKKSCSDGRVIQLEHRIKILEGELREAAAVEVGLYSIVAEHGSSSNKVHAPARRLSRLYLYACKESSKSRRASAARSAVSGLVVVAKACGNDVSRLTFWLSNTVVLRSILEQKLPLYAGRNGNQRKVSPLKWKESSRIMKSNDALCGSFDDWEDTQTFTSTLERIEAWIFSRIIESIWWQTLTPHMQSAAAKEVNTEIAFENTDTYKRTSSFCDHLQINISLELWKKAFKDACERLCPIRAGGHECGCLPMLARLIMEQCVARLDVAMFNAILRESDDEIPTDPISDPISDAKVLPIPAGKASFGAGAQLKNAVGNWSKWLTDLFGVDNDSCGLRNSHEEDDDNDNEDLNTSPKPFHLLNALSDLMMLPKDMLLSRSIRKEVCPTFGASLIQRVLGYFSPDEFCPDPIPEVVLEAINSEDPLEEGEDFVRSIPYSAAPIIYTPPPATSLYSIIGEIGNESRLKRSGSSVLKKSFTSDDELDELDSPLTTIINGFQVSSNPSWKSRENDCHVSVRYQLLRAVWLSSE